MRITTHRLKSDRFQELPYTPRRDIPDPRYVCDNLSDTAKLKVTWQHNAVGGRIEPTAHDVSPWCSHCKLVVLGMPSKPPVQAIVTVKLLSLRLTFANCERFDLESLEIDVPTILRRAFRHYGACPVYRVSERRKTGRPVFLRLHKRMHSRLEAQDNIPEVYRSHRSAMLMLPPPFLTATLAKGGVRPTTLCSVEGKTEPSDDVACEMVATRRDNNVVPEYVETMHSGGCQRVQCDADQHLHHIEAQRRAIGANVLRGKMPPGAFTKLDLTEKSNFAQLGGSSFQTTRRLTISDASLRSRVQNILDFK